MRNALHMIFCTNSRWGIYLSLLWADRWWNNRYQSSELSSHLQYIDSNFSQYIFVILWCPWHNIRNPLSLHQGHLVWSFLWRNHRDTVSAVSVTCQVTSLGHRLDFRRFALIYYFVVVWHPCSESIALTASTGCASCSRYKQLRAERRHNHHISKPQKLVPVYFWWWSLSCTTSLGCV